MHASGNYTHLYYCWVSLGKKFHWLGWCHSIMQTQLKYLNCLQCFCLCEHTESFCNLNSKMMEGERLWAFVDNLGTTVATQLTFGNFCALQVHKNYRRRALSCQHVLLWSLRLARYSLGTLFYGMIGCPEFFPHVPHTFFPLPGFSHLVAWNNFSRLLVLWKLKLCKQQEFLDNTVNVKMS